MKYVFGPVPSRRLGRSLGIDPTPPSSQYAHPAMTIDTRPDVTKFCNWNCVYCQLGRTRPFTTSRSSFFPPEAMFAELRETLNTKSPEKIDWITFVGSGEPTLNRELGTMLRGVKAMTDIPVAVITNGSLLSQQEVREELSVADAVLPTLDAGSEILFRRINRPHPDFSFNRHIEGLVAFRAEYKGSFWLELMLIAGINDDKSSLRDIATAIRRIAPDQVHIILPTRPPAESWVRPADEEGILRTCAILGEVAPVIHPDAGYGDFALCAGDDPLEAAASILARHPMSDKQLHHALSLWGFADPTEAIRRLADSGKAVEVRRFGTSFWRAP